MGHAELKLPMTAAEFLAWDQSQTVRHEFLAGEIVAMAGANDAHGVVAGNVYMALRQHLAGTPCRTFITDMKLRVDAADGYFYPDVMVTCSEADKARSNIKHDAVLVVEVLSSSTALHDHTAKFDAYRTMPTLRELLFVDPTRRGCQLYRRAEGGLWAVSSAGSGDDVHLASVDYTLTPATLWFEVPEDPPKPAGPAPS